MKYIEVVADEQSLNTIVGVAQKVKAVDIRIGCFNETDNMRQSRLLITDDRLQETLDSLQNVLGAQPKCHIVVLPVDAALPQADEDKRKQEDSAVIARESLYEEVEKNVRLDGNYILLVILSTVVASIGLLRDNTAVIIGAMVIAPLLSPNLALGLGTALGDTSLMRKSAQTLLVGIIMAVGISFLIGYLWTGEFSSRELSSRTDVGLDSILLAIASGAAAALSLTTGLSSVLVGVMVAVALLPPAVALGIFTGKNDMYLAAGAGLLLGVNIVCVNLAAKAVFFFKGIHPRKGDDTAKARRTFIVYLLGWIVLLAALVFMIYLRTSYFS